MCGVFGIYAHPEASHLAYLGLHALQHRGQESTGIVSCDGSQLHAHRAMGHVADVFDESSLSRLPGASAIGHVRYSTAGASHVRNAQPFAVDYAKGSLAIAHNGNLTNAVALREKLESAGSIFVSNSDTEVIVHLLARGEESNFRDRVIGALSQVSGAYSLVLLSEEDLIAARDPYGFRPLCMGKMDVPGQDRPAVLFASERTSFDLVGATFVREVQPGEMIHVSRDGIQSSFPFPSRESNLCVFEYVYFARPDSTINGKSVYEVRRNFGRLLGTQEPVPCDVVIPVPDSGVPGALGYAEQLGVPFEMGLIRSHYVGRTFIEPKGAIRHFGVRLKFNTVDDVVRGKRVTVVDDSIVRGTTMRKIVTMIREAGAREVHVRVSSPPVRWPCYYGIDTPSRKELIAATHTVNEIKRQIGADSLGYLSLDGLMTAVSRTSAGGDLVTDSTGDEASEPGPRQSGEEGDGSVGARQGCGVCHACFTGDYPVAFDDTVPPRRLRVMGF